VKTRLEGDRLIIRDQPFGFWLFYSFWFFSDLVVESLVYFQCKVTNIVKAVSFSFDDLDFVVDPLQHTGVDGVIAVV